MSALGVRPVNLQDRDGTVREADGGQLRGKQLPHSPRSLASARKAARQHANNPDPSEGPDQEISWKI
jgi:hypothetical protein